MKRLCGLIVVGLFLGMGLVSASSSGAGVWTDYVDSGNLAENTVAGSALVNEYVVHFITGVFAEVKLDKVVFYINNLDHDTRAFLYDASDNLIASSDIIPGEDFVGKKLEEYDFYNAPLGNASYIKLTVVDNNGAINSGEYIAMGFIATNIIGSTLDQIISGADRYYGGSLADNLRMGNQRYTVIEQSALESFAGGNGIDGDPYQIATCAQWQTINDLLTGYYELVNDLDCRFLGNDVMIGDRPDPFEGNIDGNGYTIAYNINGTDESMGLFGTLQGATIQNLGLSGTVISTNGQIGGLAGYIQGTSTIENIFGTVNIQGDIRVGGLVGSISDPLTISGIHLQGDVVGGGLGSSSYAGGLIGDAYDDTSIDYSSFSGTVIADGDYVGGLVGWTLTGYIDSSDFVGSVLGYEQLGGLAGIIYQGSIDNSSANVSIDGFSTIGGLVGNTLGVLITNSHATVDLSATDSYGSVGGIVGSFDGTMSRSYAVGVASGVTSIGGLVGGLSDGSNIFQSYADVDIYGDDELGGIAGYIQNATVADSYALGDIYPNNTDAMAGGAVGSFNGGTGDRIFALGELHLEGDSIGGLVGLNGGSTISDSFWDIWTTTTSNSDAGTGLASSTLKGISTFEDAGWSIAIGTADVNNGYPYLAWQENESFDLSGSVRFIVPQVDFLMYMNDNGHTVPGQLTHTFSIQPVNVGATPVTDATIRLYGPIQGGAATVSSGPAITNYVSGSYIEWTGLFFDTGEGTNILVDVTLPAEGTYVFTATIASATYTDTDEDSNLFYTNSTYDITTQTPTLTSPASNAQYTGNIDVSLSIPEYPSIGSVTLIFTPNDEELDTVIMTLDIETPGLTYSFSIDPSGGIGSLAEVLSTTADSIADGTYKVTLSYQDYYNNTAASSIATNVTIGEVVVAPTVSRSGGGGGMSADYCPDGDSSGSYYDNDCGNKTKAQNIVDRITAKRSSRSTERIQSTLAVLVNLNTQIQAKNTVSDSLKALFQEIVDLLISQYN